MVSPARIGILSALKAEQQQLLSRLLLTRPAQIQGQRAYHRGRLHGHEVVMVLSGIGKVAAATSAACLIAEFGCGVLLFTGTAGGLGEHVAIGDIVVADSLLQHDLDASPLFPRFEVPLTGRSRFGTDAAWTDRLQRGAEAALSETVADAAGRARLELFGIQTPRVHRGLLISGDRFVNGQDQAHALRALLPDALAVDMESAAVAQVCADHRVPFAAVRSISDRADATAHTDFDRFTAQLARHYSDIIVASALRQID